MPSFSAEERQLLDESLQKFLSENYGFERWRALSRGSGLGDEYWANYAELGWLGVALPESAGGCPCAACTMTISSPISKRAPKR